MKKLFSLIFLSITLLKIGGFIAILSIEREIIREKALSKIANEIPSKDLTCIVANAQNQHKFEWEEDEKEFWFEGQLFDIVEIKVKNGIKSYYCIADKNEQLIIAKIEKLSAGFGSNSPINNSTKDFLLVLFQPTIVNSPYSPNFNIFFYSSLIKFDKKNSFYSSSHIFKLLEPPQSFMI
ncbi:hypothetical protein EMA8858_01242 [Emticicia aquatica]|uniref:Uncharacterized protein n=1 Tax=Emticicia aquatica TaxID=1681835 RepID=A0ABM9APC2_9BACT|nr:hypothetical protein [Emticicia aquatica]CAH0995122.1 hypothetical protein EMA8858_01242 [Emticicia aquatica]